MKITVNNRTLFRFPTALMTNGFTAGIIRRKLKKAGIHLSRKQTAQLFSAMKQYKKAHADWYLVEVDCKNGDAVRIKI